MSAVAVRGALRDDLRSAMKQRDADAVAALRTAIAAIDNAESVDATGRTETEVARRELSPAEVQAILRAHVREYLTEADGYEAVARHDAARQLRRQADVVGRHLSGAAT